MSLWQSVDQAVNVLLGEKLCPSGELIQGPTDLICGMLAEEIGKPARALVDALGGLGYGQEPHHPACVPSRFAK